ncbi:MAG: AraC family transcriptional regulator [Myxococcota bacterium]
MGSDSAPTTLIDRVSAEPTVLRWRDEDFKGEFLEAAGLPPTLPTHHHPTWQIGYVRAGALRFRVSNRERVVPAPNLALVAPHRPHGIAHADDARVEYAQLELPETLYRQADPCSTGADLLVSSDRSTIAAFDSLLAASRDARPSDERRARLDELLAALRRISPGEPSAGDVDPLVCRVRSYLDRITHRSVTIGELVALGRVSRATLLRRFQRELGATPHDYHRSIRLHAACDRIDAGQSIAEASIATGFCDQPHLTRNARGVLAMGPAKWRQRRRVKA